jgi:hypothetical protein
VGVVVIWNVGRWVTYDCLFGCILQRHRGFPVRSITGTMVEIQSEICGALTRICKWIPWTKGLHAKQTYINLHGLHE